MTLDFANWTAYDEWLIENYDKYAIYKIDDNNGKITIEYCLKEEFAELKETLTKE